MGQQLQSKDEGVALPPRRERHQTRQSKKVKPVKGRSSEQANRSLKEKTTPPIKKRHRRRVVEEAKRVTRPSRRSGKKSKGKRVEKNEAKGPLIVANAIMWGFLMLVSAILVYTIRHYS